jgi:acyl-homoserine lactone acylase PvdQ
MALLLVAPVSLGATEPYRTGDFGGFRNVLPPGERGLANASDAALFNANGTYPPHANDQFAMYGDLVYNSPSLRKQDIPNWFKDGSFGVKGGEQERVYSPLGRGDVTIGRDAGFGVPHVFSNTRSGVEFGAGYVAAEDRLFFMDALRHAGRAQLSSFAGGANKQMDKEQWEAGPYNEADLQRQYDMADDVYGDDGAQLQQDVTDYVAGINAYITEARLDPNKMPVEYSAIGQPLLNFTVTDPIATASLIGAIFGKGGGKEVESAQLLAAAQKRFGADRGTRVWQDFRRANDPEAPTTVHGTSFPYQVQRHVSPSAIALPDPGSLVNPDGSASSSSASSSTRQDLSSLLPLPKGNSNALLVSAAHSSSGHPLAVMGPQVAYFMPQILMEEDLHCVSNCPDGGQDIDARGAAFPGVSLYVLLGRGQDFAWSATSAGQDIIDTFAEELCEPDGSEPTINSMYYRWKGVCTPMETLTRTNNIVPNPADPSPPETVTLTAQRTVHGIVHKRGTVNGRPVAFVKERSTYFHEADSARAFSDLNSPEKVNSVQTFQQAMSKVNFTFNWFYADDRDIGYFNSGDNPVRAAGVSTHFPNWGTGQYDWKNFDPNLQTAQFTSFSQHPQAINQDYLTSWNNKQAPDYRAADDNFSYGPNFRSQSLDDGVTQRIANGQKIGLENLIDAMEDAGTVDLRGTKVLPWMLQVIGTPSDPQLASAVNTLQAWVNAGAHRRDSNRDGHYDYEQAIQIMDAWWPRAVEAEFKPALGTELYNAALGMMGLDDAPHSHLGSAYISGWYGYVSKDLRRILGAPEQGAFSRVYCGNGAIASCRTALLSSLSSALAVPASTLYDEDGPSGSNNRVARCPSSFSNQMCWDSIVFRAIGAINVPTMVWINRPTWQQAVEVQGHRPR